MEFFAHMPPSKPEVEAPVSNDSLLSEYCRFTQVVHSMSQLEGFDVNFDVGAEQVHDRSFDGPRVQFVLYAHGALWHHVMKTKDVQLKLLRWYLQLQKFDFVVHDKGDPDQA